MAEDDNDSPGAALVRKRWEKTTEAERAEVSRKMHEARYGTKKKAAPAKKAGKKKAKK